MSEPRFQDVEWAVMNKLLDQRSNKATLEDLYIAYRVADEQGNSAFRDDVKDRIIAEERNAEFAGYIDELARHMTGMSVLAWDELHRGDYTYHMDRVGRLLVKLEEDGHLEGFVARVKNLKLNGTQR
jgi:hypothetical protein